MKKYSAISSICMFLLIATGCTKDFIDINTNPSKLTQVGSRELGFMFSRAQSAALYHRPYYQTISILMPDLYAQYYALTTTSFTTDRYALNDTWLSRPGIITYVFAMPQLQAIFDATEPTSAEYALANIMKAYVFHRYTDQFGPVPYFGAGSTASSIAYDTQQQIYDDLFKRLDSASTNLKSAGVTNVFGAQDLIYGGDVSKWIAFANTLRLRMALRISKVDPQRAKLEAEAAVAGGVMTTNAESASIERSLNGDDANGLAFNAAANEFSMSSTMASYLKGYSDPRLAILFQPAVGSGQFKGLRNGSSATAINLAGNRPAQTSNIGTRWVQRNGNAWVGNLTVRQEVMATAEAFFLKAEGALNGWNMGTGTARSFYEKGIELSMQQWGVSDNAAIQNYINSSALPAAPADEAGSPAVSETPIKWASSETAQRAQIGTQKWIAIFPDGVEAWSEFRRTGYPVMYPLLQSDNADLPLGTFIKRLPYSSVEATTNADALQKARELLGGADNAATRVWWDVD
ncbi:SusD/RagB family nutrient-binding outer membrane lipoprotein [Dyadobacter sp. CY312]|uniref:SusD/RagB family nutrient-binding outer membrane lipoprotein n=1 Tax=Dyadobacter sp. CY312 TaxID=2907303 RepID=UPI001F2F34F1|nr:SusD/RagB family nutrient-binding outer membrane lipoprotein [Dyadobacter sp. CY312]MCE7044522.1 SusD/RagB family nutrient-binding outer membrane lipoprotein [Dyadobacter sp. CY312]